jgi:hypothetical protein
MQKRKEEKQVEVQVASLSPEKKIRKEFKKKIRKRKRKKNEKIKETSSCNFSLSIAF